MLLPRFELARMMALHCGGRIAHNPVVPVRIHLDIGFYDGQ
jgi:hypothetical protein